MSAFLFPADSGRWLAYLRIGMALEILFFALSLRHDWNLLFSAQGMFGREVGEAMLEVQSPLIPRLGWLIGLGEFFRLNETEILSAIWWSLLGAALFLAAGLFCRPAAIIGWFLQLACAKSSGPFSYGADNFMTIGLFYLMIAPLPDVFALDRFLRRCKMRDLYSLGFHRRVLQLHLCIIYFFSGLSKVAGLGWWNGTNLWRCLTTPPFDFLPPQWIASCAAALPALGLAICFVELSYPALIWWRWSRAITLGAICAMHLAIGLGMGMYLFAGIMLVLNLSAFLPNEQRTESKMIVA